MKLARSSSSLWLHLVFGALLILNFILWYQGRKIKDPWDNVPPPPSPATIATFGLGDEEISYRMSGYFLQNLGNVGGRYESLKKYDYALLEKWFFTAGALDDRANFIPVLAAYYFGAIYDEPGKIKHIINYLAEEGQRPYPQKWRWLAQAIYLARYQEKNLPRALELAHILASLKTDTAPWARQMPAFVQMQMGNKEASYEIMMHMLSSEADKLHPNEINAMRAYICNRTLSPSDAAKNPLCQDIP